MLSSTAPPVLASVSSSNPSLRTRSLIAVGSKSYSEEQLPVKPGESTTEWPETLVTKSVSGDPQVLSNNERTFEYVFNDEPRLYVPGSEEEKKLLRLIDLHMFPCICGLYLLNYLDRSSIANARIGGMAQDLNLSSSDYSLAVLIFFVGYLLAEIPSNMLLTKVRPSLFLPLITFSWGLVATLLSAVQTKEGLVGVRFVLGFVESGFFPGVIFLLSSWYRKTELAKRIGFLYTAGILSGAFGGLISGGVISGLDEARGIRGWRWLFIIEGSITLLASIVAVFFLPDWPSNTKWLSAEQQALAVARVAADKPTNSHREEPLTHIQAFKAAVTDWRIYIFCFMYLMILSAATISYFLPTISTTLGYTGQTAQFMTVPFYICACTAILGVSLSADYFQDRVYHVAIPTAIAGAMYATCAGVETPAARYALICIGFAANYGSLPVALAWLSKEIGHPDSKRAVATAIVNTVANSSSIYGSFLWSNGPQFTLGFSVTSSFCFSCAILTVIGNFFLTKKYRYSFIDRIIEIPRKEAEK
ncbi:hypothetical protein CROQUDRAFT_237255 [Cronartium quercuum f. sp. fusiforme G11]|uniref:Major facilitator superfamily (MFS) profile domain-containing protein n=1 Tax=Cronartium quercuum f. sp. fusiforme G11 TaxID=708437 RepID=A0A9P6NE56_9BASI|nr:hypothetical protein CROQUDRAFT_237255 [Cronartium quercuum f. sp. fusiforme G11]